MFAVLAAAVALATGGGLTAVLPGVLVLIVGLVVLAMPVRGAARMGSGRAAALVVVCAAAVLTGLAVSVLTHSTANRMIGGGLAVVALGAYALCWRVGRNRSV